MTDDRLGPRGSYRSPTSEGRLRMENPYGDRERYSHNSSRDRSGYRYTDERETDRQAGRYRDDGYRGGSRHTGEGYPSSHDENRYNQYSSHSGRGRQGRDDAYSERNEYRHGMRGEEHKRHDDNERGWQRQNDRGGQQYYRGRHHDYDGRNDRDYRESGRDYDANRYEDECSRYDDRYSRNDYGHDRGNKRNNPWARAGRGNVTQEYGRDQHHGGRYDRNGGGYQPRGSDRRNNNREEAGRGRYGGRNDMDIDRYARNSTSYGHRGYGGRERSPRGMDGHEMYDEKSAADNLSTASDDGSDPMLLGEYMFGYAKLPPQVWEDIPTDHGTSDSDGGETGSDHPTMGVRRKMDKLDLEDRPESAKRARHEEDAIRSGD